MPGIDGAQFLLEAKRRHPDIIRIALSGYSEEDLILRAVRSAHQYLAKPCDPEKLKATIERVKTLRALLGERALRELVSSVETLPSLPSLYEQIMEELESEDPSLKRVGEIISRDVGKLILMHALPEREALALERSAATNDPLWKSEEEILNATHAEVGAYLLGVWGLPDNIVEAVAFHHFPSRCPHREFSALTAVHIADLMDYALHGGPSYQGPHLADQVYLADLGILGRLKECKRACSEVFQQQ
jgi:CheY-like chemotaxis protein